MNQSTISPPSCRLVSLDALRGFDMLWIVGLDQLVRQSSPKVDWPWLSWLAGQMMHPSWEGFTIYDLIFPLFLFIAGAAIPFSLSSKLEQGTPRRKLYGRLVRRLLLLILLGVVYNGGLAFNGVDNTRFASVLGFIGVGYFFAAMIVLHCNIRLQIAWFLALLLGYWAALQWIPVPDIGAGVITPQGSLATWMDQQFLPGRFHFKLYDPQGIMPCISAIPTALAGALTGHWLRQANVNPWTRALGLFVGGLICLLAGWTWGQSYPIIKNLWTGSFVLWTAGLSLLLLSLFYTVIDVLGYRKWAFVFVVVGMNPITIYLADRMIDFEHTVDFVFSGAIRLTPEVYWPFLFWSLMLAVKWLLLYYLYRRKLFLRI